VGGEETVRNSDYFVAKNRAIMKRITPILFGDLVRPLVITACVLVLGVEAAMHNAISPLLYALDTLFVFYFALEIAHRAIICEWKSNSNELKFWFWFDAFVTVSCVLALFIPFVDHPSLLAALRIVRVFRLFRIFSIFPGIRSIEQKILGAMETVVLFGFFSVLIIYVYAVIGMNLFEFSRIGDMNFENLYEAMVSMFVLITNDWADAWRTTRQLYPSLPTIVVDLYFFSFIGFAVIFTLNVFIAVMTSQIEQRFSSEFNKRVQNFEENIDSIREYEQKDNVKIEVLAQEMREIKELLKNGNQKS
jgi:voltage-gated sodium channel